MRRTWPIFLITAVLVVLMMSCRLFAGEDNPAPGCRKSFGMGGCFGTTVILDITIEPEIECLEIEANNCNGGVLEVRNTCQETLILDDFEIPPMDSISFDVIEEADDSYSLVDIYSNFSDFIPEENKAINISGMLGSQEIKLVFTKTAPLCDE
jgi:hypothetical protein